MNVADFAALPASRFRSGRRALLSWSLPQTKENKFLMHNDIYFHTQKTIDIF